MRDEDEKLKAIALRKQPGVTQEMAAKEIGCSQSTISNWEKEDRNKKEINNLQSKLNSANERINELSTPQNLMASTDELIFITEITSEMDENGIFFEKVSSITIDVEESHIITNHYYYASN